MEKSITDEQRYYHADRQHLRQSVEYIFLEHHYAKDQTMTGDFRWSHWKYIPRKRTDRDEFIEIVFSYHENFHYTFVF